MPVSVIVSAKYTLKRDPQTGEVLYEFWVRVPRCFDGLAVIHDVALSRLAYGQEYTGFVNEYGSQTPLAPSRQRVRKAVSKQEKKTAEALGGERQAGSGARFNKGDGRVIGKYRIENKSTTRESFRVTYNDLQKIRSEAASLEVPVFVVEFQEKQTLRTKDKWVMVPWSEWEKLANAPRNDQ
jgi:hypothetical protein